VGEAARREDEAARAGAELLFADLKDVLALEDVEQLVLSFVNVQRRVDERRHLLEHGEGTASRLGRGPDQNRHIPEDEALAAVGLEGVGRNSLHAP
jgi:hypothetical protein